MIVVWTSRSRDPVFHNTGAWETRGFHYWGMRSYKGCLNFRDGSLMVVVLALELKEFEETRLRV